MWPADERRILLQRQRFWLERAQQILAENDLDIDPATPAPCNAGPERQL